MRIHSTHLAARLRFTLLRLAVASGLVFSAPLFVPALAQETPAPPAATPQSAPLAVPAPASVAPPAATSAPATPPRGTSMDDVRSKFGAPAQEVPAVGTPPITRWEYSGYIVFFENDKVLHTVIVKS